MENCVGLTTSDTIQIQSRYGWVKRYKCVLWMNNTQSRLKTKRAKGHGIKLWLPFIPLGKPIIFKDPKR